MSGITILILAIYISGIFLGAFVIVVAIFSRIRRMVKKHILSPEQAEAIRKIL